MGAVIKWTTAEKARLLDLWQIHELPKLVVMLGRPAQGILSMAWRLGLSTKRQGYESLREVAERTGLTWWLIAATLRQYRLRTVTDIGRGFRGKSKGILGPRAYVATLEINDALEARAKTEPIAAAAKRCGVCCKTLIRALATVGTSRPRLPKGHVWRVDVDLADRALREYDRREDVVQSAARIGVTADTMRCWLRAAGIPLRRRDRHPPEEADRAARVAIAKTQSKVKHLRARLEAA